MFPDVRIQRWLTQNIDLTPNLPISLERETHGPKRNEIEAKFITVSENISKSRQMRSSDSEIAEEMDSAQYDSTTNTCRYGNVKVKAHTRTRNSKRNGQVVRKQISHTISVPYDSDRAFKILIGQLEPVLVDSEILALCDETQRSLLDSAAKILRQGR